MSRRRTGFYEILFAILAFLVVLAFLARRTGLAP
jgi:hypothetical protein